MLNGEKSEISEEVLRKNENLTIEKNENQWVHTVNENYALMTLKDFFIPEFEKTIFFQFDLENDILTSKVIF